MKPVLSRQELNPSEHSSGGHEKEGITNNPPITGTRFQIN
jgi:hypothetical protein